MISVYCTFNNVKVPILSFKNSGGAYGTVSSIQIETTIAALAKAKVDLYKISGDVSGSVEVYVFVKIDKAAAVPVFGGIHNLTEWDYDTDVVTIHARGWEELIADQRRVMTGTGKQIIAILQPLALGQTDPSKGISTQNQKISSIVTSIAELVGLKADVADAANDHKAGVQSNAGNRTFFAAPQNLWMVLCELARDTGNIVYVSVDKRLVFGPPGYNLKPLYFSYMRTTDERKKQAKSSDYLPTRSLKVTHQPRRNGTFRVQVQSYNPANEQIAVGRATAIGGNRAQGDTLKAGVYQGTGAQAVDKQLSGLKGDTGFAQVPLYVFHYDGLTADQANAKAMAVATDIAKHELILSLETTLISGISPGQKIILDNASPGAFGDTTFYVTDYQNTYSAPNNGEHGGGLMTHVVALNIPTEGLARDASG